MARIITSLVVGFVAAVIGAGSTFALSPRGKQLLDRFDQKRAGWEVGKHLIEMLPKADQAPERRRMAISRSERVIEDANVLVHTLTKLLAPFPADDKGDARYKAALKWLADFEAQIGTWKTQRQDLIDADERAGQEQKRLSAEYKAEAAQHDQVLKALAQASLQLETAAKKGNAVDRLGIQRRPTEILERAALLEIYAITEGKLDTMAANCKARYVALPNGWAPRCQEAVFARAIAARYKERAATILAAYEKEIAARVCPPGNARDKKVEKDVTAAFKKSFGKEYQVFQVRMDGPVATTTGVGTLTESANVIVCYRKLTAKPEQCGVWPIGFERHRAGRGPWSKWAHSGNNGPGADLLCRNAKK